MEPSPVQNTLFQEQSDLFLKILSGMANSVDPDQTAPSGAVWSGSTLFAYAILLDILVYEILDHLPYIIFAPKVIL